MVMATKLVYKKLMQIGHSGRRYKWMGGSVYGREGWF